jgi:hypothetical protein
MNKVIESIVPLCFDEIKKLSLSLSDKDKTNLKSHINAFGPTIVNNGFLNTILLYYSEGSDASKTRSIFLGKLFNTYIKYKKIDSDSEKDFLTLFKNHIEEMKKSKDYKDEKIPYYIEEDYKIDVLNCYFAIKAVSKIFLSSTNLGDSNG